MVPSDKLHLQWIVLSFFHLFESDRRRLSRTVFSLTKAHRSRNMQPESSKYTHSNKLVISCSRDSTSHIDPSASTGLGCAQLLAKIQEVSYKNLNAHKARLKRLSQACARSNSLQVYSLLPVFYSGWPYQSLTLRKTSTMLCDAYKNICSAVFRRMRCFPHWTLICESCLYKNDRLWLTSV